MENSWNLEIRTKSHGRVVEFDQQVQHFLNWRHYAATYISPSCLFFVNGILSFGPGKVIESHGNLSWKFRGNPDKSPDYETSVDLWSDTIGME